MTIADPKRLAGSVNLDSALEAKYPRASRWDYAVGVHHSRTSDQVTWIEIHPANTYGVEDMLAKVDWLKEWLGGPGAPLNQLNTSGLNLVWLSTGKIAFRRGSTQHRQLSQAGLRFPVRHVELG